MRQIAKFGKVLKLEIIRARNYPTTKPQFKIQTYLDTGQANKGEPNEIFNLIDGKRETRESDGPTESINLIWMQKTGGVKARKPDNPTENITVEYHQRLILMRCDGKKNNNRMPFAQLLTEFLRCHESI